MGESHTRLKVGAWCVFGLALFVLGYQLFVEDDPIKDVPDDEELKTAWACHQCGEVQHLTPRRRVELQRKASAMTVGGKVPSDKRVGPEGRTSFRGLVLLCPKCGKLELRRAATCPACNAVYPSTRTGVQPLYPEDRLRKCPQCGWKPTAKKAKRRPPGQRARRGG
jgi:predicted RNA-binding Zn-ribbon protein involved in translation (DUF1610 family)